VRKQQSKTERNMPLYFNPQQRARADFPSWVANIASSALGASQLPIK
jgi:hypothetical protein